VRKHTLAVSGTPTITKRTVDNAVGRRKMNAMNLAVSKVLQVRPIGVAAQYARSFYDLVTNRRKYDRTPISGSVRVTCSSYGVEAVHACSCENISLGGMAVDCPDRIAPDTVVGVQAEDGPRRQARVCYCQALGTMYRIGLEFTAGIDVPQG